MNKYQTWINDWLKNNFTMGMCQVAVHKMKEEFSELVIKKGFVYCEFGKRKHWWLEDSVGTVIDPTVSQFAFVSEYVEYQDGMEIACAVCADCGGEIFAYSLEEAEQKAHNMFCSTACADSYADYLNSI